jgi:hypothetical protein
MDANEKAIEKSNEAIDGIATALRELADKVENGLCNDPDTDLFDADAFWVDFADIKPLIVTVKDNQKMD